MNNKSTENLVESEGSVEEIHTLDVSSLDVKSRKVSASVENNPIVDVHQKKTSNSFLAEKSDEDGTELKPLHPPVPATRKLSLPPIASKRNVKDLKENSNKLMRKQSLRSDDTIQVVNERITSPKNKHHKNTTESESDSDIRQNNSSAQEKRNKIELSLISKEAKKHLGRQFVSSQVNEETTSFISYEEKHEKEDNSEHNDSSNHSSANNLSNEEHGGRKNEAFVPDDDLLSDEETREKMAESAKANSKDERKTRTKSKKKEKKTKTKSKKSKSKREKSTEEKGDDIESAEEHDTQEAYDFKRVIGNYRN